MGGVGPAANATSVPDACRAAAAVRDTPTAPQKTRGLHLVLIDRTRLMATAAEIASAPSTARLILKTLLENPSRTAQALTDSLTCNNLMVFIGRKSRSLKITGLTSKC